MAAVRPRSGAGPAATGSTAAAGPARAEMLQDFLGEAVEIVAQLGTLLKAVEPATGAPSPALPGALSGGLQTLLRGAEFLGLDAVAALAGELQALVDALGRGEGAAGTVSPGGQEARRTLVHALETLQAMCARLQAGEQPPPLPVALLGELGARRAALAAAPPTSSPEERSAPHGAGCATPPADGRAAGAEAAERDDTLSEEEFAALFLMQPELDGARAAISGAGLELNAGTRPRRAARAGAGDGGPARVPAGRAPQAADAPAPARAPRPGRAAPAAGSSCVAAPAPPGLSGEADALPDLPSSGQRAEAAPAEVDPALGDAAGEPGALQPGTALTEVLLVECNGVLLALRASVVVDLLEPAPPPGLSVDGQALVMSGGRALALLSPPLGGADPATPRQDGPVVVVRYGAQCAGLRVERVLGRERLAFEQPGPLLDELAELAGVAVAGNGRVALLVELPAPEAARPA